MLLQSFFLYSTDSNIICISPEILVLLTTAQVIERSIRSQTVNIGIALKNIVPKYLIALVASIIFFYSLLGIFVSQLILVGLSLIFDSSLILTIGILGVLILFVFLVIFSGIILSFTHHAIALRNYRLDAFNYSWALIKSRLLTVLCRYIGTYFLFSIQIFFLKLLLFVSMPFIFESNLPIIDLIDNLILYFCAIINTIIFLNFEYTYTEMKVNLPNDNSTSK